MNDEKTMPFEQLTPDLFRVLIPFEEVTTTVYIVVLEAGTVIVDSATYPSDVDGYILPALRSIGVAADSVRCLALTHTHSDHAGGIARLSECFPWADVRAVSEPMLSNAKPLLDGEVLLGGLQTVFLPGHTPCSMGFLHLPSRTLLSGDCLQLAGVGKYRNGIMDPQRYIASAERLLGMDIERIVAAHEYDPLGSIANGRAEVERYLRACIAIAKGENV